MIAKAGKRAGIGESEIEKVASLLDYPEAA
jgi:hypothetical protein